MNRFACTLTSLLFLSSFQLVNAAVDADAILTHRAVPLMRKLQMDLSNVPTFSAADLTDLKERPITGSVASGLNVYLQDGDVRILSRQGGGFDLSGGYDSVSVMRPNSLFLSLTVLPNKVTAYANHSYDLSPYLPGCRLYVFYRENLLGHVYPDDAESTSTQRRINRVVAKDLQEFGIKSARE